MKNVRKDKYCLKGEYYSALEEINIRLGFFVPKTFRKEVYGDLLELFYRNQSLGKPLKKTIGKNIDIFIDEIVESFYLTLSKTKILNYVFQKGLLHSILCTLFYIVNLSFKESTTLPFSMTTIIFALFGFIVGIFNVFINYKALYRINGVKKRFFQAFLTLYPMYTIIFADDYIFNMTKGRAIDKGIIILFILIEITAYIVLILIFKDKRKSE